MKINLQEFGAVINRFHDDPNIYQQLSFGQFFCNRYNVDDTELFFADYEKAVGIIMDNYLDLDIDYSTPTVADYEQNV